MVRKGGLSVVGPPGQDGTFEKGGDGAAPAGNMGGIGGSLAGSDEGGGGGGGGIGGGNGQPLGSSAQINSGAGGGGGGVYAPLVTVFSPGTGADGYIIINYS